VGALRAACGHVRCFLISCTAHFGRGGYLRAEVLLATGFIAAANGKHLFFPNLKQNVAETVGLNVMTVVVILASNVFLFITVPCQPLPSIILFLTVEVLSRRERHHLRTSLESFIMIRLLFFQVLNTVIVTPPPHLRRPS
jgi:hypothetical protein